MRDVETADSPEEELKAQASYWDVFDFFYVHIEGTDWNTIEEARARNIKAHQREGLTERGGSHEADHEHCEQ
jgi:2,3-bisphosphoglycerate-independent phosphoglycerate mutase